MLTTISRTALLGGWFSTLAVSIELTLVTGFSIPTLTLLIVSGVMPAVIMVLRADGLLTVTESRRSSAALLRVRPT